MSQFFIYSEILVIVVRLSHNFSIKRFNVRKGHTGPLIDKTPIKQSNLCVSLIDKIRGPVIGGNKNALLRPAHQRASGIGILLTHPVQHWAIFNKVFCFYTSAHSVK